MGVDSDSYLRELNRSLGTETTLNADNLSQIRDAYRTELQNSTKQIMESYSQKERELLQNAIKDYVKDHGYDTKGELDNLRDFLSTNGSGGKGSGEPAGIEVDEGTPGSGEPAGIEADGGAPGSGEPDEIMEVLEGISDLTEEELERLLERIEQFLGSEHSGSGAGCAGCGENSWKLPSGTFLQREGGAVPYRGFCKIAGTKTYTIPPFQL